MSNPDLTNNFAHCALCDEFLTDHNDSKEHIIPNSIGGHKKIKGYICEKCNNTKGHEWDNDLAKNLNPLALFFGIFRDRGKIPSQIVNTTGGYQLKIHSDGSASPVKPTYNVTDDENQTQINIIARNIEEAKLMLKGTKKKYPLLNIDETLSKAEKRESYIDDKIHYSFSFGGPKSGRSIVKTAVALIVKSGINYSTCENALNYLKNEDIEPCFGYYYETDLIKNRVPSCPLHCVFVKGNPNTRQILAYVEYFGVQRIVGCLSDNYEGNFFTSIYAIDPRSGDEIDIDIDLNFSAQEIISIYNYEKVPENSVELALSNVIAPRQQQLLDKERDRVVKNATNYAFANCGAKEGGVLMPEHVEKLTPLIMEKIRSFIEHNIKK